MRFVGTLDVLSSYPLVPDVADVTAFTVLCVKD